MAVKGVERCARRGVFVALLFASLTKAAAPVPPALQTLPGGLQLLRGDGSNIVIAPGAAGTLMVDAEYAASASDVLALLERAHALPVHTLVDTHWHEDHVGANAALARQGALVVAHQRSAVRLQADQTMSLYGQQAAAPPDAWPRVALAAPLRLQWNGESVDLIPMLPAHTDGDLVVRFNDRNVLVTGDLFVGPEFRPPYFDDLNGGSTEGMLAATDQLLQLADERTLIIPGHGAPTDRRELAAYRAAFVAVRDRIREGILRGLGEDAVVALHPAQGFAIAGRGTDRWVRIVYREYQRGVPTP